MPRSPIAWYDSHADAAAASYESVHAATVNDWLRDLLPEPPAAILDVGAGSGRDAAWLTSLGYEVTAAEPSKAMRAAAQAYHADRPIHWIDDHLPGLTTITRSGVTFDLIVLNAVWMHLGESDRKRAFRKLINLLKAGGLLTMTLRMGSPDQGRDFHPVAVHEIEPLARDHGAHLVKQSESADLLGRKDVRWQQVAIQLPDDGSGALPLLRHIILNDNKSSTYKLALLRTLCRIADNTAGLARDRDDGYVAIPLGLVGLTWLRLFKPLLAAHLPQSPNNIGLDGLGFVKGAYRQLDELSCHDLRIGMMVSGERGSRVNQALRDAVDTIVKMPATHITYPNGHPCFPIRKKRSRRQPGMVRLDHAFLLSFGEMLIPHHLWTTLRRFDAWIEPVIIAEWSHLIRSYAEGQNRTVDPLKMLNAMTWDEPTRDVHVATDRARTLLQTDELCCIWSGKRLSTRNLEIDHCLPWSVWPCGDLWNLMPCHSTINSKKSAKLPSDSLLRAAHDRMFDWWETAYGGDMMDRFWLEATSSLPSVTHGERELGDVFDAICFQRMRLKLDQQVPEWHGQ